MKLKTNIICKAVTLLMILSFALGRPSVSYASEVTQDVPVYYDTEEGRFVNDLDQYIRMLDNNEITPFDSVIETYELSDEQKNPLNGKKENEISLASVEDPSKSCSNIFGHKWGDWHSWSVWTIVTYADGKQCVWMERYRYCERTFCGASQRELDGIWLN